MKYKTIILHTLQQTHTGKYKALNEIDWSPESTASVGSYVK